MDIGVAGAGEDHRPLDNSSGDPASRQLTPSLVQRAGEHCGLVRFFSVCQPPNRVMRQHREKYRNLRARPRTASSAPTGRTANRRRKNLIMADSGSTMPGADILNERNLQPVEQRSAAHHTGERRAPRVQARPASPRCEVARPGARLGGYKKSWQKRYASSRAASTMPATTSATAATIAERAETDLANRPVA